MDTDPTNGPADEGPGFPRWLKWGLLGALAILIVGYGIILLYAKVINDSPDELDATDLDAALATDGTTTPSDGATTGSSSTVPSGVASPDTIPAADGARRWNVTDASQLGYRVKEILFGVDTEAVGRTNRITGGIVVEDTEVTDGEFVVDVASITSDESRRDGQFRGRIMSTDQFPDATFTLTQPIELGTEPVEGASVSTSATGDLTLHGVTNRVTFELEGRVDNGRIGVLGNIPVVFADYDIPNPSFGGISTDDNGLLEFVLVFEPA